MANEIHTTTDYGIFKKLTGNRAVDENRKNKIVKSIETFGWVTNPIIVNSNMEVLDGQGRLEALKELGLPVEFIISNNTPNAACVAMNFYNTRWNTKNYIDYFGENGNANYKRLKDLAEKYDVRPNVVLRAAKKGQIESGSERNNRLVGKFLFSEDDYNVADRKLFEYKKYLDIFSEHRRNQNGLDATIFFCIENGIDTELLRQAENNYGRIDYFFRDIESNLKYIEEIYNYRKRSHNRVFIVEKYKKTAWGKKYGKKVIDGE